MIVVGGTGFIGKNLCLQASKIGKNILVTSRNPDMDFIKKYTPKIESININSLIKKSSVFLEHRSLVYLASSSTPATDSSDFYTEFNNNIKVAIDFFDMVVRINPNIRIIYISSGGTIYGSGHTSPIKESDFLNPNTYYAYGKVVIEQYIKYLSNAYGCTYTILRPSNPVGNWNNSSLQGFISVSLARVFLGENILLYGDGKVVRDYISVIDLADVILTISNNKNISMNKTWNISSGIGISLNEIVFKIKQLVDKEINIKTINKKQKAKIPYCVLDPSLIFNEMNWKVNRDIDTIIIETWKEISGCSTL